MAVVTACPFNIIYPHRLESQCYPTHERLAMQFWEQCVAHLFAQKWGVE